MPHDPGAHPASVDLIVLAGGRGSRLGGVDKASIEVAGRTLLSRALDARAYARHVVVVGPDSARPAASPSPSPGAAAGAAADEGADADSGADTDAGAAPHGAGTHPRTGSGTGAVGAGAEVDTGASANASEGADADAADSSLTWTLEDPPFGGPVAGIAAGLAALVHRNPTDHPGADWVLLVACDIPLAADVARLLVNAVNDPDLTGTVDGLHLVDEGGRPQWLAGVYRARALRAAVRRLGGAVHGASMRGLLGELTLQGIRDPGGIGNDVDTWQDVSRSTTLLGTNATDASAPHHDTFEE